jgi:hypothetical protein
MGVLEDSRIEIPLAQSAPRMLQPHAPPWSRLEFAMEHQKQTLWCWAATSVSVSQFYDERSDWTQCDMANAELGLTSCCPDGAAEGCNVTNTLEPPLKRARVFDRVERGSISFERIREEIDEGRPLAWRIEWPDTKGHFAVIEGYQPSGRRLVAVEDPWTGSVAVPFEALLSGRYPGNGRWTHSYFTRKRG